MKSAFSYITMLDFKQKPDYKLINLFFSSSLKDEKEVFGGAKSEELKVGDVNDSNIQYQDRTDEELGEGFEAISIKSMRVDMKKQKHNMVKQLLMKERSLGAYRQIAQKMNLPSISSHSGLSSNNMGSIVGSVNNNSLDEIN
jgi:hypothetical protein